MKTMLVAFLGVSLLAGFATQSSAAVPQPTAPNVAAVNVAAADYDNPAFGTQQWWQLQEDRG